MSDRTHCPTCGSPNVTITDGYLAIADDKPKTVCFATCQNRAQLCYWTGWKHDLVGPAAAKLLAAKRPAVVIRIRKDAILDGS